jgi:WD40 repeat protein
MSTRPCRLVLALGLGLFPSVAQAQPNVPGAPGPAKEVRRLVGSEGAIHSFFVTKDDKLLYSSTGWPDADKRIRVWDLAAGKPLHTLADHDSGINQLVPSPNGTQFLSCGLDGQVLLWDIESNEPIRTFKVTKKSVANAAWTPDGTKFVTVASDKTVRLWDAATGKSIWDGNEHEKDCRSIAFVQGGKKILVGDHASRIRIWDVATGSSSVWLEMPDSEGWIHCLAATPDGRRVVVCTQHVRLYDVETSRELMEYKGNELGVLTAAISPNAKYLVTGSYDYKFRLHELDSGKLLQTLPHQGGFCWAAAFAPGGQTFFTGAGGANLGKGKYGLPPTADLAIHVWRLDAVR